MAEALYNKYRPETFGEVIGHDSVVKSLRRTLEDDRTHAYLFTGPSGVGKTTLARIAAAEVCGDGMTAANLHEVDAATHTGVDAMREINRSLLYRALGGNPTKVVIIDECQLLSKNAWTALLKSVEEPSPHVYWMFCTTEPNKVPKTIKTRSVRYDLDAVSEEDILNLLIQVADLEESGAPDEVLETISENCEGSPRQALVYLEQCMYCDTAGEARGLIKAAGQSKEIIDLCRFLVKGSSTNWSNVVKLVAPLRHLEPEAIRISVVNYVAVVLLNTKDGKQAPRLLHILDQFTGPYNSSEKMAPILLAVGGVLYGGDDDGE